MEARLIIDAPAAGAWNMAVDEALLESAASGGRACLRFYQWSEPTLTLGYFQSHADRQSHPPSAACPCVRRATGGGAIVHDRELTYSFTLPVSGRGIGELKPLYEMFHQTLIEELAAWGAVATLCNGNRSAHLVGSDEYVGSVGSVETATRGEPAGWNSPEPFLCFQRRCVGDVLLDDVKVCGSAQRRHRGALLQHGSVLLRRSRAAPELPGIEDQTGRTIVIAELLRGWQRRLADRLGLRWVASAVEDAEARRGEELRIGKFECPAWNCRR